MRQFRTLFIIASLIIASSALNTAGLAQEPTAPAAGSVFKTHVDLVSLSVTVTDRASRHVSGLCANDFQVYEDGVQQALSFFAASHVPIDLALLIDTSASMTDKMTTVQEAALGFVRTLRSHDRAAILDVKDHVRVLQPFTSDPIGLETAILSTQPRGGTALYNATYVALKEFARLARENSDVRRQAIVMLSDGQDTVSLVSFDDVLDLARRSGVNIYTITLRSRFSQMLAQSGGGRYFSQSEHSMRALARETGALAYFPNEVKELANVYGAIADELASQYSLGYTSRNPKQDGAFRRVIVRVIGHPNAQPRTRMGYFGQRATPARATTAGLIDDSQ